MNDKRNILLYVIIGLLVVIIIFLGILLFKKDNNDLKNDDNVESNVDENITSDVVVEDSTPQISVYSSDELYNKLKGIWKYVDDNGLNYVIRIYDNNGVRGFIFGRYATDGGIFGNITDISYVENNMYKVTVFAPGCHGEECLYEYDDYTYEINFDVSDIDNRKFSVDIGYNSNGGFYTYEYVTDNWDEMDRYFSY